MKRTILMTITTLLITNTVFAASVSQIANRIVNKAEKLQRVVEDYDYGSATRRDVRESVANLKQVINRLEKNIGNTYGPDRPSRDNFSATCKLDISGNFLFPDSKVECSVYGKNAAGYEVLVTGEYINHVAFSGDLNSRVSSQRFETEEERVGGRTVRYDVFILTTNGNRVHVDTL